MQQKSLLTVLVLSDGDEIAAAASARSARPVADEVVVLERAEVDWTNNQDTQRVINTLSTEWLLVLGAGEKLRIADVDQAKATLQSAPVEAIGLHVGLRAEVRLHKNNGQALEAIGSTPQFTCRELSISSLTNAPREVIPTISVIVPTFNQLESLRRCLRDLCVQTTEDFEVIVVNDGGLDVSEVTQEVDMVVEMTLINNPQNSGVAAAINNGLAKARGKYVHILADTDTLLPHHLEALRGVLDEAQSVCTPMVAYGPAILVAESEDGTEIGREVVSVGEKAKESLMTANFILRGTAMFDRVAAQSIDGFDVSVEAFEDWDFWLRMAKLGDLIYIDEPTAEYRPGIGISELTAQTPERRSLALRRIFDAHPVAAGSHLLQGRAEQIRIQDNGDDDTWDQTVAIIGNGHLGELGECLKSVTSTLSGGLYQLILHELRTPQTEMLLTEIARDAAVCFYSSYDETLIRLRIERQAGGRPLTILHSSERLDESKLPEVILPGSGVDESSASADPGLSIFTLDYPVSTRARYGHGKPVHPGINAVFEQGRSGFEAVLSSMVAQAEDLARIPLFQSELATEPFWNNGFFMGIDAALLYTMIATEKPRRYLEVGSGNSTRFARRAISDHGLDTHITSIDPEPRAECDSLCDRVIRSTLETVSLDVYDEIEQGDIVFFDGSHRSVMNSDATVFFLDVIPSLPAGTLVHVHDIFWPQDYPPDWADRIYSEQYLLGARLLAPDSGFDVVLPAGFVAIDERLRNRAASLWAHPELAEALGSYGSFWFRTR